MLIFPLKKEWYEKIKSGEKTVEYREVKPYWTKRLYNETIEHLKESRERFLLPSFTKFVEMFNYDPVLFGDGTESVPVIWKCILRFGYTNRYMTADITRIEVVDGKDTDLHIDKPVYAIHLTDVKEE